MTKTAHWWHERPQITKNCHRATIVTLSIFSYNVLTTYLEKKVTLPSLSLSGRWRNFNLSRFPGVLGEKKWRVQQNRQTHSSRASRETKIAQIFTKNDREVMFGASRTREKNPARSTRTYFHCSILFFILSKATLLITPNTPNIARLIIKKKKKKTRRAKTKNTTPRPRAT